MESEYVDNALPLEVTSNISEKLTKHLPAHWPQVKELIRAKSCSNTNVFSTCVNQAQSHLELLQNAIYDWLCENEQKRHLPENTTFNSELSRYECLEVVGEGLQDNAPLHSLGVNEVIDCVTRLITRLESSRLELEKLIQKERKKVALLAEKIDNLSHLRMRLLPDAVEREHENCADNIEELQWHILHQTNQRDRLIEERDTANLKRQTIEEEIQFIVEHCPLLQEKLNLELEMVNKIKGTQTQIHEELTGTTSHLEKVKAKHKATVEQAEAAREKMRLQIATNEKELHIAVTSLAESRKHHATLTETLSTAQQQLANDKEKIQQLTTSIGKAHGEEVDSTEVVKSLKSQLQKMKQQRSEIQDIVDHLLEEEHNKQLTQEGEKDDMTRALHNREDLHKQMRRQNEEWKMICNDLEAKLKDCENQVIADDKNVERMSKELLKTQAEVITLADSFERIVNQHTQVKDKLENEERRVREAEDKLRHIINQLEKQIQDEIKQRGNLQTRIKTDTLDLSKSKEEAKLKRKKMRQMVAEIEKAVQIMLEKVQQLRKEKERSGAVVSELQTILAQLKAEYERIERELQTELDNLQPGFNEEKKSLEELEKKWKLMNWQVDMMNKKLQEILEQTVMVKRTREKMSASIRELETIIHELTVQNQSNARKELQLQSCVKELQQQLAKEWGQHELFMMDRNGVLKSHLDEFDAYLATNQHLAGQFRDLQNNFIELKERYVNLLAEKILNETAIVDLKQVEKLQKHLQFNLLTFLRYKDQYSLAEFERLADTSSLSAKTVTLVNEHIVHSIKTLHDFIESKKRALLLGQRFAANEESTAEQ